MENLQKYTKNKIFTQKIPQFFNKLFILLILNSFIFTFVYAQFNPCNGKALLNESCDKDADCELKGSICLRQTCQCHPFYQMVKSEKGGSTSARCSRLPAKVGQECQSKCREPLFCRGGRCQCVQRGSTSIVNGECVSVSRVGDRCSRHYDCTSPFSACVNHQCVCISGTIQQGSKCVATSNCPLGGAPAVICTRKAQPSQILNFVEEADTCSQGFYCVTTPESPVGHCCPAVCPLGSSVDSSFSCISGGSFGIPEVSTTQTTPSFSAFFGRDPPTNPPSLANLTRIFSHLLPRPACPSETHFCHFLAGDTFSQAICCKRPCNSMAPESLYLNGECVTRGQLGSECRFHEQCGAAEGMTCVKGQCQCIDGFSPLSDVITHPTKNPSQQCRRDCDKSSSISRDTNCLSKSQLGGPCFVQEQCPDQAGCYRGRCLCRCGYKMANSKCIPLPPPSTQRPQTVPSCQKILLNFFSFGISVVPNNPDLLGIFSNFFTGGVQG
uniref:EB domain-containing protein n=1 Tax=Meloidogyne incognita TaxID=6306 RepID=A0A914LXY5_MELIC